MHLAQDNDVVHTFTPDRSDQPFPKAILPRRGWCGLVQIAGVTETTLPLIRATISAGMTASIIILTMSLGLIVKMMIVVYLGNRSMQTRIRKSQLRLPNSNLSDSKV
jgi:hypothetical protein